MKLKLVVLLLSLICVGAPAQTKPIPAAGAAAISTDPPAGAQLAFAAHGDGVQIYTCEKQQENYGWTLKGPKADLFDPTGKQIGTHFAGPTWKMDDGSAVQGTLVATQKQVTAIAWLLLSAKQTGGAGALDQVKFIRRTDTVGGRAPAVGCDAQHEHAETSVPYSAKYSFYR
jgi:hypothetical protein